MKNNENGFGALPVIIVLLVIGVSGFIGFRVLSNQNNKSSKNNASPTNQQESAAKQVDSSRSASPQATKSTTQEVVYKGAKFSLTLPEGWTYRDVPVLNDEKLSYFTDPAKKVQLEVQIIARPQTAGQASSAGTMDASHPFTGIDGKKYFLAGYTGTSKQTGKYEVLQISADCQPWHCYTPINDAYSLSLNIRSTDPTTPISIDDPLVNDIKSIVATIKLN